MSSGQAAVSVSGKRIRLTEERWSHIENRHPELRGWREKVLKAVADPNFVVVGQYGELVAARLSGIGATSRFLVVVYRESGKDGFIITAFLTSDVKSLERRRKLWSSLF